MDRIIKISYFLKYLKPYRLHVLGIIIALLLSSSSVLSIGLGIRHLIDDGFSNRNANLLNNALFILLAITVVLAIATYSRYYLVTKLGDMVMANIRKDIYDHLLILSPSYFEMAGSGRVVSRIIADTTLIQSIISTSLAVVLRNMLMLIGGLVMLLITSIKLSAIVAIVVPLVVIPIISLGRKVRKLSSSTQEKIANLSARIEETVYAIKTVQAYSREEYEKDKFSLLIKEVLNASQNRIKKRALLTAMVIVLTFSAVGLVLWMGGHDVLNGRITAGSLSAFIFYSIMVSGAIGAISEVVGEVQRASGAADGLINLMQTQPDILPPSYPVKLSDISGELRFDRVTFFYPSRKEQPALDGISLNIKAGEKVAIVGMSGAGKSTIFQLALRFYDPTNGQVLLDNIDLKKIAPEELRKQFAIVSQEPVIFSATAMENIKYGKENATDEEAIEAAKRALAYDFIKRLPEGFNTYLGEKGVRISGGERQRIAIARAVLREPKILLLDEATNSLDAENEQMVQEALEKLMMKCTTIVIAHRLSTILKSDRIIVMDKGKIIQEGRHEDLINREGLYSRLAELQFNIKDDNNPAVTGGNKVLH